jgi:hypothetical protein
MRISLTPDIHPPLSLPPTVYILHIVIYSYSYLPATGVPPFARGWIVSTQCIRITRRYRLTHTYTACYHGGVNCKRMPAQRSLSWTCLALPAVDIAARSRKSSGFSSLPDLFILRVLNSTRINTSKISQFPPMSLINNGLKCIRINTSGHKDLKSPRINTSGYKDLKSFRINTSKKQGGGWS